MDPLDFSTLSTISLPVKVGPKEFLLREANGMEVEKWKAAHAKGFTVQGEDESKVTTFSPSVTADMELLASCLTQVKPEGGTVTRDMVSAWPNRVFKVVFEKLKEISELDKDDLPTLRKEREVLDRRIAKLEKEGSPAGNGPSSSTAG